MESEVAFRRISFLSLVTIIKLLEQNIPETGSCERSENMKFFIILIFDYPYVHMFAVCIFCDYFLKWT